MSKTCGASNAWSHTSLLNGKQRMREFTSEAIVFDGSYNLFVEKSSVENSFEALDVKIVRKYVSCEIARDNFRKYVSKNHEKIEEVW